MNKAVKPLEAAQSSIRRLGKSKLLVLDRKSGDVQMASFSKLAEFLNSGDVVVVNDAATLPASL